VPGVFTNRATPRMDQVGVDSNGNPIYVQESDATGPLENVFATVEVSGFYGGAGVVGSDGNRYFGPEITGVEKIEVRLPNQGVNTFTVAAAEYRRFKKRSGRGDDRRAVDCGDHHRRRRGKDTVDIRETGGTPRSSAGRVTIRSTLKTRASSNTSVRESCSSAMKRRRKKNVPVTPQEVETRLEDLSPASPWVRGFATPLRPDRSDEVGLTIT